MTFLVILCAIIVNAGTQNKSHRTPVYPQVWHYPDSAIINPMLCDTIILPTSYTMMIVYQSLQPDTIQRINLLSLLHWYLVKQGKEIIQ